MLQQIKSFTGLSYLTEEQKRFIAENESKYTCNELSRLLEAKRQTIWNHCKKNGIILKKEQTGLTEQEKKFLQEHKEKSYYELAREIGRSKTTVKNFLKQYTQKTSARKWSKEEDAILRQNINLTDEELMKLLPCRSISAIKTKRHKLNSNNSKKRKIIEFYKNGESITSISGMLHTSNSYVRTVLASQNLIEKRAGNGEKAVAKINPTTGATVANYESISEAARQHGKSSASGIWYAISKGTKAYGFKWQYID